MSELLVDSSCNPIKTNYIKPDTDDGLVDGDEIVIVYGKTHIPHVNGPCADFKSAVYLPIGLIS